MMPMVMHYPVRMSVTCNTDQALRAVPIRIGIDNNLTTTKIHGPTTINFEFVSQKSSTLLIEIFDKQDQEAVIIEKISFFNIEDPRFVWTGIYHPCYPEPWATEQKNQGVVLQPQLKNQTYLGWNGKWTLTFKVPIFTWIHKIQNLGWIYC